jgi:hypothetical protein
MTAPIIVIAFNRPLKLARCLDQLRDLENPIYIWIDGPRLNNNSDLQLVEECAYLSDKIGLTNFSIIKNEINRGTDSVVNGITWILERYEQVIVIEDDVVVSKDFIFFCERMLDLYKENKRVGCIAGSNNVPKEYLSTPNDYFRFSCFFYAWGWATWKDRWEVFLETKSYDNRDLVWPETANTYLTKYRWREAFKALQENRIAVPWDYKWIFVMWKNRWLSIVPNLNFVLNIGFDEQATHTKNRPTWTPDKQESFHGVIQYKKPLQDLKADRWSTENVHYSSALIILKRLLRKYLTFLSKLSDRK